MLRGNIKSMEAQSDPDWQQTMMIDGEGRGVGEAQAALANFAPYVRGEWVWVLDDDDLCIRLTLVEELKAIAADHDPDVIMTKMDHGQRGILPDDTHWQKPPVISHIGASAYIVKRQVWQRHAYAYSSAEYSSDFDFINAIFSSDPEIYWHDCIASKVQRISLGAVE
jgi:hypothetical protein